MSCVRAQWFPAKVFENGGFHSNFAGITQTCQLYTAEEEQNMAYKYTNSRGVEYYLHHMTTALENGEEMTFYFFSKDIGQGALESMPEGHKIGELTTEGRLPVLVSDGAPEGAGSFLIPWQYPSPGSKDST